MRSLEQKLFFVLGKGGVGRTTVSSGLGLGFSRLGEKVLLVQWSLKDSISPLFHKMPCGHREQEVAPNLFVMNYSVDETVREYVVSHLGMRLLYKVVVENRHVQKLMRAVPGLQELFFLGRLFWLVELAQRERGWSYDRIIVDCPATGHGFSLFTIPSTVAGFGIAGPLASECERVASLLNNEKLVGAVVVTAPEELPVEELLEFLPEFQRVFRRPPILACINRSVKAGLELPLSLEDRFATYEAILGRLNSESSRESLRALLRSLERRHFFEERLEQELLQEKRIPVVAIPDGLLVQEHAHPWEVVRLASAAFARHFAEQNRKLSS